MTERKKGIIAAVLHSCIIGFSFLAVKASLRETGTPILLAHRFAVAFFGAAIVSGARKIDVRIGPRDLLRVLPLAAFYPILYFWLQSAGLERTPSSLAGILQSTAPVFSALLAAVFLKERADGTQIAGIVLTIAGVAALSLQNTGDAAAGDLMGPGILIGSAFVFGCYSVLSRKLSRTLSAFTLTFWMLAIGFAGFTLYTLISLAARGELMSYLLPLREPGYLTAILYLGILSSLASSYLSNYALARMEAAKMNVFGSLATVISVVAGVVFLREPHGWQLLVGLCVILAGVLLVNRGTARRGETAE